MVAGAVDAAARVDELSSAEVTVFVAALLPDGLLTRPFGAGTALLFLNLGQI